jgi:acyl dehydratase
MTIPSRAQPVRTFDWDSQNRFARFSGDRNPIHMDPMAARRTHAGQPVVHGMHAILWALETLARDRDPKKTISQVKARFQKLIYLGEPVALEITRQDIDSASLQLQIDGLSVTYLNIAFGEPKSAATSEERCDAIPPPEWPEEPIELSLSEIEHANGWLAFAHDAVVAESTFPFLSAQIGARRVSALACMSRLVGMVCPGLNSTFFSLTIHTTEQSGALNSLRYKVTSVHDQFRLVKQTVEGGGWSGTIESIARFPPVSQDSLEHLAGLVQCDEFHGTHALIIGGSRGLGELTAKLIAAGGGEVTITYAVGLNDALEVQRQIKKWGGTCEIMQYDATLPASEQLARCGPQITSLYYFATTAIFLRKTQFYSRAIFERFSRIYVDGFYEACISALQHSTMGISVFYPSSVAVVDRPADMTEYAMAKSAGEILCVDLERSNRQFRILVERLPRMLTDQTATVIPAKAMSPVEVMLPIVRCVEEKGKSDMVRVGI